MTWFKERFEQYKNEQEDLEKIKASAYDLFELLWKEVLSIVDEAHKSGLTLHTSGQGRVRQVFMGLNDRTGNNRRELTIVISENRKTIQASSDAGMYELVLTVCPDGVVCFQVDGEPLDVESASRYFTEPFLFNGKSPLATPSSR